MSNFSSNSSEGNHSVLTTFVGKRDLTADACDEIPAKRFASEKENENSSPSSPPRAENNDPSSESELNTSDISFETVRDNSEAPVLPDSTDQTGADVKPKETLDPSKNSKDNVQQDSTVDNSDVKHEKKTDVKAEIILKIGTDYASDGELENSPLPDLPPTSPISDKSEMSPFSQELLMGSNPSEAGDKNQTCEDANTSDSSDEDFQKPEGELSADNQNSTLPGKSFADSKSKSEGIELVNFSMKPFCLPETERFGCCRLITEFEKIFIIGEGAFGLVYKVLDKKSNSFLALKKLKFQCTNEDILPVEVVREINILKTLEHPNIVNSQGIAVGSNFNNTYLILDLCECDLSKIIDDEKSSAMLTESEIKCILLQLFEGLKYIHFNHVIHRDLSCSNVLFTSRGILKIGDFGSSRNVMPDAPMTPNVVSRWYRAPELLFGETIYTASIDIWSSGCILAETHLKRPLFKAKSDMEMIAAVIDLLGTPTERIWRGVSQLPVLQNYDLVEQPENRLRFLFKDVSAECFSLLEQLLIYDPKERITAAKAGYHHWFLMPPTACSPDGLIHLLVVAQEVVRLKSP